MNQSLWKVLQVLIDLGESLGVITAQQDLFPEILWRVGTFDGFHAKVYLSVFFSQRRVQRVRERTARSVAQTRDRIWVLTKCGFVGFRFPYRSLVRTKLVIDHLPYHFIVLHLVELIFPRATNSLLFDDLFCRRWTFA